jgi:hypothetical protein
MSAYRELSCVWHAARAPSPPEGLISAQMLQCESVNVAVRFVAAVRFTLRRAILGVIVIPSLLSRFERGARRWTWRSDILAMPDWRKMAG